MTYTMRTKTVFHSGTAARLAVGLLVLAGLVMGGCHESSSDGGGAPDGGGGGDDSAITAVHTVSWAVLSFVESGEQAYTAYDRGRDGLTLHTCPSVTSGQVPMQMVWDYEAGCAEADGRVRRGRMTAVQHPAAPFEGQVDLGYDRYHIGDTGVDGRVRLRLGRPAVLTIRDGVLTRGGAGAAVEMDLTMDGAGEATAEEIGGRYVVGGAGTVRTAGEAATFEITDPLVLEAGCPYPSAGAIAVTRTVDGMPPAAATVRFAVPEATCDDVAEVTHGGEVLLIRLAPPVL